MKDLKYIRNQCWELIENANMFLCFPKMNSERKGLKTYMFMVYTYTFQPQSSSPSMRKMCYRRSELLFLATSALVVSAFLFITHGVTQGNVFVVKLVTHLYSVVIWTALRLKSPTNQLLDQQLIQTNNKENIKAPHNWPLWGEPSVISGFPSQRVNIAQWVSVSRRHYVCGIVTSFGVIDLYQHFSGSGSVSEGIKSLSRQVLGGHR